LRSGALSAYATDVASGRARIRLGAVAIACCALLAPGIASAHTVAIGGAQVKVGVSDHDGLIWSVQVTGIATCSGADKSLVATTFRQIRSYGMPGAGVALVEPPPNAEQTTVIRMPPGTYEMQIIQATCHSTAPTDEGDHQHTADLENIPVGRIDLPVCRRLPTPPTARSAIAGTYPLLPIVEAGTDKQAICPTRPCDVLAGQGRVRAAQSYPLIPVEGNGEIQPAPCPTITAKKNVLPLEVICGPGAVASSVHPILPIPGRPCAGRVIINRAAGGPTARAAARRTLGTARFRIKRGSHKAVRVIINPLGRRLLRRSPVLYAKATVVMDGKRKTSKRFMIVSTRRPRIPRIPG
jgi:hypothetical protein